MGYVCYLEVRSSVLLWRCRYGVTCKLLEDLQEGFKILNSLLVIDCCLDVRSVTIGGRSGRVRCHFKAPVYWLNEVVCNELIHELRTVHQQKEPILIRSCHWRHYVEQITPHLNPWVRWVREQLFQQAEDSAAELQISDCLLYLIVTHLVEQSVSIDCC